MPSSRRIVLEVPELSVLDLEEMSFQMGLMERESFSAVELMKQLSTNMGVPEWMPMTTARVDLQRVFMDLARLLEAVRLSTVAESYDSLTDGEIAIVRCQKDVARKLDTIIDLLKEVTIEKRNTTPAEKER